MLLDYEKENQAGFSFIYRY